MTQRGRRYHSTPQSVVGSNVGLVAGLLGGISQRDNSTNEPNHQRGFFTGANPPSLHASLRSNDCCKQQRQELEVDRPFFERILRRSVRRIGTVFACSLADNIAILGVSQELDAARRTRIRAATSRAQKAYVSKLRLVGNELIRSRTGLVNFGGRS